jgi:pregnancy-associated plasma protein-A/type IX secretion system substrate protein
MTRKLFTALAAVSLAAVLAAPIALAAGEPDVGSTVAGEPDVGQTRWITPDNVRPSEAGEALYRCGTDESGPKVQIPRAQVERWLSEHKLAAGGQIPVYFHVIYSGSEGNVPESQLDAQILVLNRNYAGKDYNGNTVPGAAATGYTFTKAGTDRTNNRKWFTMTPGTQKEAQAKNALSISPGSALNIYICKPGQNLLGWAVFPWTAQAGTKQDGVVIHYGSLPGGYLSPYNLGGTASHEVGHYLGLYHTFQGGCDTGSCSTTGDLVCDTPAEATATSGCPGGKDTCPASGLDPIHNYMDYSTDICYTNFTTGQDTRMNTIVTGYRGWIGATRIANGTNPAKGLQGDALVSLRAKPNPFNPRTKIEFGLQREGHASLRLYDIQGRLVLTVVDHYLPAGNHTYDIDGSKMASGVYMMKLQAQGQADVVRMITLLK